MTKKRTELLEQIKDVLRQNEYTEDRYGNWVKDTMQEGRQKQRRYKFQPTSLRCEVRTRANLADCLNREVTDTVGPRWSDWMGIWTAYYKHVQVTDGKIQLLKSI